MVGLNARTTRLALVGSLTACGPSLGSGDGGGSTGSGAGTSTEASGDTAGHEETGMPDAGTGVEPVCTRSDLPEPFCHELLVYDGSSGARLGVLDQVRGGFRPLVVSGGEEFGLRLINPLDPEEILAAAPPPLAAGWEPAAFPNVVSGNFSGDEMSDFIVLGTPPGGGEELAMVDGASLEVLASRSFLHTAYGPKVGVVDLDGDGIDELVTGESEDAGVAIRAWTVQDGQMTVVASEVIGVHCGIWTFVPGDFDGDGLRDLALAWNEDCDVYFRKELFGPPRIATLLGGSDPQVDLGLRYSAQPPSMQQAAGADFDGDGDTELLIARSVSEMIVLDWGSESFAEAAGFGINDYESMSFHTLRPGAFAADGSVGVLAGFLLRPKEDGTFDSVNGVFFPDSDQIVLLPGTLVHVGSSDSDLNADGITDFHAYTDERYGVFLSHAP